jgi:arylsulfatase A-like enzyme
MKLLVLVARGLQAGACGPYGNRLNDTSALDALAAQGVVFDHHFAVHPDPATARRVWRSGRYHFPQPPGTPTGPATDNDLLRLLHEQGTTTHLILDDSRPTPEDWLVGWHEVRRGEDHLATIEAAQATLHQLCRVPCWLVWVELASLLPPWSIPDEILERTFALPVEEEDEDDEEEEDAIADYFDEEEALEPLLEPPEGVIDANDDRLFQRLARTYAAALTCVDALIGELLEGMQDDVLVLFTSDHGQALGEHGVVGPCRPWLHNEIVHVPLLLAGAGCTTGKHVPVLTTSLDIPATIADLAGVHLPGAHGRSLLPYLGVPTPPGRDYVCLGTQVGDSIEWALRTPDWMLQVPIVPQAEPRLYLKPADRWEVNNVVKHHLEYTEALTQTLREFVAASQQPGPLQPPALPQEQAEASEMAPPS